MPMVSALVAQISVAVSAQTSGRAACHMALGSAIGKGGESISAAEGACAGWHRRGENMDVSAGSGMIVCRVGAT